MCTLRTCPHFTFRAYSCMDRVTKCSTAIRLQCTSRMTSSLINCSASLTYLSSVGYWLVRLAKCRYGWIRRPGSGHRAISGDSNIGCNSPNMVQGTLMGVTPVDIVPVHTKHHMHICVIIMMACGNVEVREGEIWTSGPRPQAMEDTD